MEWGHISLALISATVIPIVVSNFRALRAEIQNHRNLGGHPEMEKRMSALRAVVDDLSRRVIEMQNDYRDRDREQTQHLVQQFEGRFQVIEIKLGQISESCERIERQGPDRG